MSRYYLIGNRTKFTENIQSRRHINKIVDNADIQEKTVSVSKTIDQYGNKLSVEVLSYLKVFSFSCLGLNFASSFSTCSLYSFRE